MAVGSGYRFAYWLDRRRRSWLGLAVAMAVLTFLAFAGFSGSPSGAFFGLAFSILMLGWIPFFGLLSVRPDLPAPRRAWLFVALAGGLTAVPAYGAFIVLLVYLLSVSIPGSGWALDFDAGLSGLAFGLLPLGVGTILSGPLILRARGDKLDRRVFQVAAWSYLGVVILVIFMAASESAALEALSVMPVLLGVLCIGLLAFRLYAPSRTTSRQPAVHGESAADEDAPDAVSGDPWAALRRV